MFTFLLTSRAPAQHVIGFSAVFLLYLAIWGYYAWCRKRWLDKFYWYPTYGLFIHPENFMMPSPGEVDGVVWKTIQNWKKHHPMAEYIVKSEVIWVFFKKNLDETAKNPAKRKVEGFVLAGSRTMYVDYDSRYVALEQTAFEHELGHIIRGAATGEWDMEEHHQFAAANGLK